LKLIKDDNFWKEHENKDFDAETADDLDVDMSVYYEPNGGDKDSRDLIDMRRMDMLRSGADAHRFDDEKMSKRSKLNVFQAANSNKSIEDECKYGRELLEKSGWKVGEPVGNPLRHGLKEPLDASDGKHPMDRTGLGYHGQKVDRDHLIEVQKAKRLRESRNRPYSIASRYDNDPSKPDSLLRRYDPTMKYRTTDKLLNLK
jgi:hypothetical protein